MGSFSESLVKFSFNSYVSIVGIFCPPLLIPGMIVGGVGAATGITTTIVELSVQHKNKMIEILKKLQESGVVIVYNNTISNAAEGIEAA